MKTAIITGAAKGIGKSMAFKFVKEKYKVILVDISDELLAVKDELNKLSGGLIAEIHIGDVADPKVAKNVLTLVNDFFNGTVDILINNAGIIPPSYEESGIAHFVENLTDDSLINIFNVNIFSMFYFCREIVPVMKKQKFGKIINIGSVATYGLSVNSHYSASKAAVEGLTRTLAKELADFNISVYCIAPGLVDTGLISPMTSEQQQMFLDRTITKKLIPAWEVSNLAIFLANSEGQNMTGQIMDINAGKVLR